MLHVSPRLGSVSCATMLASDLIPAFMSALEDIWNDIATSAPRSFDDCEDAKRASARITDTLADIERRMANDDYFDGEDCDYDLEALFDLLGDFAPAYCYFGAHEGDGADYGFWVSHEALEDDCRAGDILKLEAGEEWPEDIGADYVLEVSDHGNCTLFEAQSGRELWAIV